MIYLYIVQMRHVTNKNMAEMRAGGRSVGNSPANLSSVESKYRTE